MTEPSPSSGHGRFIRELTPWTNALSGNLLLPIKDAAPHRTELLEKLWIQFTVPATSSARDTARWIQALRLLDVLASANSHACWQLIVDLCGARAKLRTLGCPLELLTVMRPRFELHFDRHAVPSDDMVTLLMDGHEDQDQASGSSFSQMKTELLMQKETNAGAPLLSIPLRFDFAFGASESCSDCRARSCDVNSVRYLQQVLACADRVASPTSIHATHFTVESFGFGTWYPEVLRQIACKIPLHAVEHFNSSGPRSDFFGPFLWRMVAPHENVRAHLGLRRLVVDYNAGSSWARDDAVAALCSAVSSSRILEELSFKETIEYRSYGQWPAWLAFALFSKTARHQIRSVNLTFGRCFPRYVDAIKHTIEQESGRAVEKPILPIQWPPTTVQVDAQTKIHGFELPEDNRATTVYHGKRPVECFLASQDYGSSARILIPGVGIGCVARKDVLSAQPATLRDTHSIRNLSLQIMTRNDGDPRRQRRACPFDAVAVLDLLRLIGEPLEQLTLASIGDRPTTPLLVDDILVRCPDLKSLKLVNLTLSAEQLYASRHGRVLQSLTLLTCNVLDKSRRIGCAAYIPLYTFPLLTSLYVDARGASVTKIVPELASVHDYVLELATQRRLHRLVIRCDDAKQRIRYAAHVERHDGEPIPVLPVRDKLAFLSVVTAGPSTSSTAKFELTMDVAQLVFELASTTMRRRVCTLLAEDV